MPLTQPAPLFGTKRREIRHKVFIANVTRERDQLGRWATIVLRHRRRTGRDRAHRRSPHKGELEQRTHAPKASEAVSAAGIRDQIPPTNSRHERTTIDERSERGYRAQWIDGLD